MSETNSRSESGAYGTASIAPTDDVIAGSFGTWTVTYTAGPLGMDDGSTIKIASNMTSDWGKPQFDDPAADNYATVETSAAATVEAQYDPAGYVRPWKHTVTVNVFDGSIPPGETIILTLGERSGGSPGQQMQTFPENDFEIVVLADAFGTGEFVRVLDELTFDVIPGQPTTLSAHLPSSVSTGETVELRVRLEDYWGNTATHYDGTLDLDDVDGLDTPDTLTLKGGVAREDITVTGAGVYRLTVHERRRELTSKSNPLVVDDHERDVYWGDIHGQSGETVGTGTVREYFNYAKQYALLDFASHAGNDFQITDDLWEEIQRTVREYNDPGNFVTFLCYEWSANTPVGGDHNVYFRDDEAEIHRSSHWQIADDDGKYRGTYPVSELYDRYRGRDDVLIIPHQGGRPSRLDEYDPDLTPFIEILSVWGVFEWFGQEALERGYRVGFSAGSDDHTGRPGASRPTNEADWSFPINGGVMAVQAEELTRESLWEAFIERRCYGTTGARIFLDIEINGAGMGERVTTGSDADVAVEVCGTAPIRSIELFRGSERIDERIFGGGREVIESTWTGERSRNRHKVIDWSGGVTLSKGIVTDVEEFGFDHPAHGVLYATNTDVRWKGSTAGNHQGLRLVVDAPEDAIFGFHTEVVAIESPLAALPLSAGDDSNRVKIRKRRVATETDVETRFSINPKQNTQPYYIRVRQEDGEMAWSTPIFVTASG